MADFKLGVEIRNVIVNVIVSDRKRLFDLMWAGIKMGDESTISESLISQYYDACSVQRLKKNFQKAYKMNRNQ